jgi:isoleucyl-tRNA synthetase
LDNTLSPELIREGMAREFVNRIQNLRKDSGFEVTDKITILIEQGASTWEESINEFKSYISQEVQALAIDWTAKLETGTILTFDEDTLMVQISK